MFSSFLLCSIMEVRWWIAIVLILVSVFVMVFSRISNFFLKIRIDGLCVVHLASFVIMIQLETIQPLLCISSINRHIFLFFLIFFHTKSVISVGKFYKLYYDVWY